MPEFAPCEVSDLPAERRAGLAPGLALLHQACTAAHVLGQDPWEFAVGVGELQALGLNSVDLRWLVVRGYAVHAVEVYRPGAGSRTFRPTANLGFEDRTCLVLTDPGLEFAARRLEGEPCVAVARPGKPTEPSDRPEWDACLRVLTYRGRLVKRFRVPAASQETILAAFEEEGWPPRVDDPLPGVDDLDRQQRLHDGVRGLNRSQCSRLLKFFRDGRGKGVCWCVCERA